MNPTRAITAAALTLVNAWLLMLLLVIAARCLRQPTLAKQGDAR